MNTTVTVLHSVAVNTHSQVWADALNERFASGERVEVQGRVVTSKWFGKPATAWQNGSLSVTVEGRRKGTEGTVWVKSGETFTVSSQAGR